MNAVIAISGTPIRTLDGLFSLNDLHKASGGEKRHKPANWLANQQTSDLIKEIEITGIPAILKKQGLGTFACQELVVHYGMWISPAFSLQVIRAFLDKQPSAKTSVAQRESLRHAVNYLVGRRRLQFDEAYRLIHQRFSVTAIDEIPAAALPQAVAYCHALALDNSLHGEVIDAPKVPALDAVDKYNLKALCTHMRWVSAWFRHYYPAIKLLNSRMAGNIHDHFQDGSFCAATIAKHRGIRLPSHQDLQHYPWDGDYEQRSRW